MQSAYQSDHVRTSGSNARSRCLASHGGSAIEPRGQMVHLVSERLHGNDKSSEFFGLGIDVVSFRSAREYLDYQRTDESSCIVLDLELPEMAGLALQRCLSEKASTPIIVIGDQSDFAACVSAMKAGAIDFLAKPLESSDLIEAVQAAFTQDRRLRQRKAELTKLQRRFGRLTPREREVLPLVIGGLLNKQAASLLGISEVTLQIHRSQVMRKMEAESLADLVRMAVKLRVPYWQERPPSNEQRHDAPTSKGRREATNYGPYLVR